ncbi:MAG TPA: hypothetical protein VFK46_00495, partial [Candidatus Macondimonas sp.]|nr:hypothetical protein [Candidatus Macondimonas sp.]
MTGKLIDQVGYSPEAIGWSGNVGSRHLSAARPGGYRPGAGAMIETLVSSPNPADVLRVDLCAIIV